MMMKVMKGDKEEVIIGINEKKEKMEELKKKIGIDKKIWWRYIEWIGGFIKGELGKRYKY